METPSKIKPALIGGIVLAILSLMPIISAFNCCCLWTIAGGALAAWIYIKDARLPVKSGEGAAVGALAGFVGGIITAMGQALMVFIQTRGGSDIAGMFEKVFEELNDPKMTALMQPYIKFYSEHFILVLFVQSIFAVVSSVAVAMLGGVIGVSLFEKRKDQPPAAAAYNYDAPPPPPQYQQNYGQDYGQGYGQGYGPDYRPESAPPVMEPYPQTPVEQSPEESTEQSPAQPPAQKPEE